MKAKDNVSPSKYSDAVNNQYPQLNLFYHSKFMHIIMPLLIKIRVFCMIKWNNAVSKCHKREKTDSVRQHLEIIKIKKI